MDLQTYGMLPRHFSHNNRLPDYSRRTDLPLTLSTLAFRLLNESFLTWETENGDIEYNALVV